MQFLRIFLLVQGEVWNCHRKQKLDNNSLYYSQLKVRYSLPDYETFLRVNRRLSEKTIKESCRKVRNFVKFSKGELNQSTISKYLACFLDVKPTTYNSHITDLRRFVRDFLGQDHLISSFKMAPIDFFGRRIELPTKKQLRKGFGGLTEDREKAIFLFTEWGFS